MATRFTSFDLFDQPRRLRFDPNAVADLEGVLGMSLSRILGEGGIRVIRAMLWAGLKWEDRGLTLERVGTLMAAYMDSGGTVEALVKPITGAMAAAGWIELGPTITTEQGNEPGA